MAWLGKQGKTKRDNRSVDMSSATHDGTVDADRWDRPDPESCEEVEYRSTPDGADATTERFVIRQIQVAATGVLVEFALIYLTFHGNKWIEVAEIDSCHDDDVHLHQNGRHQRGRVSEAVSLAPIRTLEDVQTAYDVGLTRLEDGWRELKDRWHHA